MFDADGGRRKLIVFTEHRDTMNYLVDRLRTFLGERGGRVASPAARPARSAGRSRSVFTQDQECLVLVATDAAGEGINLQRAHLVINYDLPWNPNRIEQRFGRVHRIGQTEVCHMWNLVADDTREAQVYLRLLDKIAEQQRRLPGAGVRRARRGRCRAPSCAALLIEAIRYGDDPDVPSADQPGDRRHDRRQGAGRDRAPAAGHRDDGVRRRRPHPRWRWNRPRPAASSPTTSGRSSSPRSTHLGGALIEREPGRFELRRGSAGDP